MGYLKNIIISIDQFLNTLLAGNPDETLSSRCGKSKCKLCVWLCNLLDKIDYKHCEKSIEYDNDLSH